MKLLVLQMEHSPYCIPITRALEALGVPFEVLNVSNADRREVIEATGGAYYQVPVLVVDDRVIFESSSQSIDIARTVDELFGEGRLFPANVEGLQRILIPYIEDRVESVTFRLVDPAYLRDVADPVERTMIRRHKERKFGVGCVEAWDAARADLTREAEVLLEPFERMLEAKPFLLGDRPVFTDFALFGILGNLTYRQYNDIPPSLVRLAEWYRRLGAFRFDR